MLLLSSPSLSEAVSNLISDGIAPMLRAQATYQDRRILQLDPGGSSVQSTKDAQNKESDALDLPFETLNSPLRRGGQYTHRDGFRASCTSEVGCVSFCLVREARNIRCLVPFSFFFSFFSSSLPLVASNPKLIEKFVHIVHEKQNCI